MCQVVNFTGIFLPPATKLGQGNIFRSVCQEFCSQGGGSPGSHLGACWGVLAGGIQAHTQQDAGGLAGGGLQAHTQGGCWGVWLWECPGPHLGVSRPRQGDCIPACTEADPPPDGYCCRQYASYWNAFLLFNSFRVGHDFLESFTPLRIHYLCTTCI